MDERECGHRVMITDASVFWTCVACLGLELRTVGFGCVGGFQSDNVLLKIDGSAGVLTTRKF